MTHHGFFRVAAAVPALKVADCAFNIGRILHLMERAQKEQVDLLVFPELAVTGYTCADLFHQTNLQHAAQDALTELVQSGQKVFSGLTVVGLPLVAEDQLFNCAAVFQAGLILGVVPKSFIPNYKEFYERRWFAPAANARVQQTRIGKQATPFGTDLLFDNSAQAHGPVIGIEICEDLWVPIPPSSFQALGGATVLVNLSASNEIIGKDAYRRQLVLNQSGRCLAAYVYASSGVWESTTDVVFGGHCLIAENGAVLAEAPRLRHEETLLVADVDLERLRLERMRTNSFAEVDPSLLRDFRRIPFTLAATAPPLRLARQIEAHPFVPQGQEQLRQRCQDIFQIQITGLAKRLEHLGKPPVYVGISGGLDSTLALLVATKTFDQLDIPRSHIHGLTMPGFGTTARTRGNAHALMTHLGVSAQEIDIRGLCLDEMRLLGHQPFGINLAGLSVDAFSARLKGVPSENRASLVFENVQARMRTSILMNSGFVVGTGDLSELALGWCTYNGDHASMYNPNVSIPKTLVKFLVRWAADNEFAGEARGILHDIVQTEISPELLPAGGDGLLQSTEKAIGPYELHDFFLFHFLRFGAGPEKILYLARQTVFEHPYSPEEIRRCLRIFLERFFTYQFKRSFLPDGPKVGTVSLSPRGDWRMPSDAQAAQWLQWLKDV
jgi:NAD+ synthase (glutamine-hydrolysing)